MRENTPKITAQGSIFLLANRADQEESMARLIISQIHIGSVTQPDGIDTPAGTALAVYLPPACQPRPRRN